MSQSNTPAILDRRRFLYLGGLTILGGMMAGSNALAGSVTKRLVSTTPASTTGRSLTLHNLHTHENLNCRYWSGDSYDSGALSAINRLLRDHRTGDIHRIDPAVLDFMSGIAHRLQVEPVFHVISGFRSEQTNSALKNAGRGVAKKSFHLLGQAVDIRMPEVEVGRLHKAALALDLGGVGLYRGQDFVHIDTGPVRRW